MLLGLLGDVHGAFDALERVLGLEPDIAAWLCVGDVADDEGRYPSPSRPIYFIKGNNEDFDVIARLAAGESISPNLHYLPNGTAVVIPTGETPAPTGGTPAPTGGTPASTGGTAAPTGGTPASTGGTPASTGGTPASTGGTPILRISKQRDSPRVGQASRLSGVRVAGLGGTFAPKWFETAPDALPAKRRDDLSRRSGAAAGTDLARRSAAAAKADKRRHFVRQEVDACAALRGVDLFLTHEAPRPYWVGTGRGRNDAGKTPINEILAAMKPRLHVFGHHHRLSEAVREGVPSLGLPLVADGYAILDTATWAWTVKVDWTTTA